MNNLTKIIATIGPASCDKRNIKKIVNSDISVVRLNGSHNTLAWHKKTIADIRSLNKNIPILFDIPGEKIRIDKQLEDISFFKGDRIIFSKTKIKKDKNVILTNNKFYKNIKLSMRFSADDGNLIFKVKKILKIFFEVISLNNVTIT